MKLFIAAFIILSLNAKATTKKPNVIYGEDNRQDVYKVTNEQFKELAASTAAMIPGSSIKQTENGFEIIGPTMIQRGVCASEKFANQITAANCSGFLISEDLIATAGHCLRSQADCEQYQWVFNYKQKTESQSVIAVGKEDVLKCKKLIKTVVDSATKNDFAIVQVQQKTDKRPLKFRSEGTVEVGADLVVIGHPTGLPTKIADGAKVRQVKGAFFIANLDTYGGNSGSAVFDANTGIVEGILVRGETDYVRSSSGCMISNVCSNTSCRGEDVTHSKTLVETLKLIRK
jgi:V8-like Glu-specific endopeptidase